MRAAKALSGNSSIRGQASALSHLPFCISPTYIFIHICTFLVIEEQTRPCASSLQRLARHNGSPAADVFHSTEVTAFLGFETPRNLIIFLDMRVNENQHVYLSQNIYQFVCSPPNVSLFLGQQHVLVLVEHVRTR